MVTSYSSTNVTLVATMMMVLMILSMCEMFDNCCKPVLPNLVKFAFDEFTKDIISRVSDIGFKQTWWH
jgi:hypothetical protein